MDILFCWKTKSTLCTCMCQTAWNTSCLTYSRNTRGGERWQTKGRKLQALFMSTFQTPMPRTLRFTIFRCVTAMIQSLWWCKTWEKLLWDVQIYSNYLKIGGLLVYVSGLKWHRICQLKVLLKMININIEGKWELSVTCSDIPLKWDSVSHIKNISSCFKIYFITNGHARVRLLFPKGQIIIKITSSKSLRVFHTL